MRKKIQIGTLDSRVHIQVAYDPLVATYAKAFGLVVLGLVPAFVLGTFVDTRAIVLMVVAFAGEYFVWLYLRRGNTTYAISNALLVSAAVPLLWGPEAEIMGGWAVILGFAVAFFIVHQCVQGSLLDAYRVFRRA